MFYCRFCTGKNGRPLDWYLAGSRRPCEICGKVRVRACADVHHLFLNPVEKAADSTEGGERGSH